ncbi:MAG: shikimate kinase [Bacteroidota bacterium]|nr:shikimate kinase [Bacteroidota bacterium]
MRIILVGFMGVGKTTVGRKIARKLNSKFVDLDMYIELKNKASLSYIFNLIGEDGFRIIEQKSMMEVVEEDEIVLSTGGGTPCFYDNMNVLNDKGFTVYLSIPPQEILKRLYNYKKKRPLVDRLSKKELYNFINEKFQKREKFYKKAKFEIHTSNIPINKVSDYIIEKAKLYYSQTSS